MRPGLVVIESPRGNGQAGLLQRFKPVLIEALIPEDAVKALNVCVLRRTARLNQDVLEVVLLSLCNEGPASKLRPVVGSDSLGVAPKQCCSVQKTGHVIPAIAKVSCDIHALVREVVSDRQAFDAPGDGAWPSNGITKEVHAPRLVDFQSRHQWYTHANTFGLLAFPDRQTLSGVDAVHTFVIDARKLGA